MTPVLLHCSRNRGDGETADMVSVLAEPPR